MVFIQPVEDCVRYLTNTAEVDYRLVEGGGEQIQLDALTARLVTHLSQ